jgi:hypothetical protein
VVDSIGVGGGVVDRLRELKAPILAYTGSAGTELALPVMFFAVLQRDRWPLGPA